MKKILRGRYLISTALFSVIALVFGTSIAPVGAAQDAPSQVGSTAVPHQAGTTGGSQSSNWVVASDGGVFAYGNAGFFGSAGSIHLNKPVVGIAATPDSSGYWLVASDGGVFAYGNAGFFGSAGDIQLVSSVVGMASTFDGAGYWLVAADGGVFSFGNAKFYGSLGGTNLQAPIVAMAATPDGAGYWLLGSDGGVFAYGDASFYGSPSTGHLSNPVVSMASSPDGAGYWVVTSTGEVFGFGSVTNFGSYQGTTSGISIISITSTVDGAGYWLTASNGDIFNFGDAGAITTSSTAQHLNAPVVGMATEGILIPSTTTKVNSANVVSLSGTPGSTQTLILNQGTIPPPVGQVLEVGVTPATPSGFLGTVTSTTTNPDGTVSVSTQPASLDDVFTAGTFSLSGTLDATDLAPNIAGGVPRVLTPHDLSPHRSLHPIVITMPHTEDGFECSGGATFTAGGSLSILPSFNFTDSHDFLSLHPYLQVSTSISTTESAEVDATVAAHADCTYTKTLAEYKFQEIEIEGIIIQPVLSLELSGTVGVEASVSAQIVQTATATIGLSAHASCNPSINFTTFSVSANCSAGASPIDSASNDITPTVSADGTVDTSVELMGKLALEIEDGLVSPYIEAGPKLEAKATAGASNVDGPSASWSMEACLEANAGVEVKVGFDYEIGLHSIKLNLIDENYAIPIVSLCKEFGGEGDGTGERPVPPSSA